MIWWFEPINGELMEISHSFEIQPKYTFAEWNINRMNYLNVNILNKNICFLNVMTTEWYEGLYLSIKLTFDPMSYQYNIETRSEASTYIYTC